VYSIVVYTAQLAAAITGVWTNDFRELCYRQSYGTGNVVRPTYRLLKVIARG